MDPEDQFEQPRTGLRNPRLQAALAIAIAILTLAYLGLRPAEERDLGPAELRLEALRGGGVLTNEDLRGRPLVLNFWASWCDPCRDEMPAFEKLWRAHRRDGLQIVGVNIRDRSDFALGFLDEVDVTYPVVTDPDKILEERLGITGLPVTLFVRPEPGALEAVLAGRIDDGGTLVVGEISEERLADEIDALLASV